MLRNTAIGLAITASLSLAGLTPAIADSHRAPGSATPQKG